MTKELSIVLGYVISFVYMALVIVVGELVQKKFNTDKELTRKCEHIATSASWAICYFFVGATYHLVIVNFFAMCALAAVTFGGLMKSVERDDADKSYGLFYFGLSTFVSILVAMLVNVEFVPYTAVAYYCLALGDGLAPITARLAGKRNLTLFAPKSLVGFLTVFAVCSLVALVVSEIFSLGLSALFILSLGSLAAHAELYGRGGFDNVTINFSVFGYLVLNYYGLVSTALMVALLIIPVFTVLAAASKSLTTGGAVVSFVYIFASALFGNLTVALMIFILFFVESIISKVTTRAFNKKTALPKEKHSRGAHQILANTAVAIVCITLYFFLENPIFLFASVVVIAEEFSDSIASDVGRLSRSAPRDILKFKTVEAGISGGVSLLGIGGALIAAFAATTIPFAFGEIKLDVFLILAATAFVGTIFDSILGSAVQGLFRCSVCDSLTEHAEHCGTAATRIKGAKIITNSMVNFLSGAITAAIAIGILSAVL